MALHDSTNEWKQSCLLRLMELLVDFSVNFLIIKIKFEYYAVLIDSVYAEL